MPAAPKRTYTTLTNGAKQKLCAKADEEEAWTHEQLVRWATGNLSDGQRVSRTTVLGILKRKRDYMDISETDQCCKNVCSKRIKASDALLMQRVDAFRDWHPNATITSATVVELARHAGIGQKEGQEGGCKYSKGWLHKVQRRTGLWFRLRHGESGSVNMEEARKGRERLRVIASQYDPSNVYNMDETSFFYQREPKGTLSIHKEVQGKKQSKARLTICVAANAKGTDRRPLHFIGKSKVPRPLKGRDVRAELGVTYCNSAKAWMTSVLYSDWLDSFNEDMKNQGRHVLLLVDNVSSHKDSTELSNVRVEKLPPNTTAVLQPMDQGPIKCLKDQYSKKKTEAELATFLNGDEYAPVDVYRAMKWCAEGCESVSESTIQNCWLHTGLVTKMDINFMLN